MPLVGEEYGQQLTDRTTPSPAGKGAATADQGISRLVQENPAERESSGKALGPGRRTKTASALTPELPASQPMIQSPYLTAKEAAEFIRSTVQGIYALVKRGRLRPMPGSGKLLFTREALDECLQKRRHRTK